MAASITEAAWELLSMSLDQGRALCANLSHSDTDCIGRTTNHRRRSRTAFERDGEGAFILAGAVHSHCPPYRCAVHKLHSADEKDSSSS